MAETQDEAMILSVLPKPYVKPERRTAMERLGQKIALAESGCWIWTGTINWNGYGKFAFGKVVVPAHRASYMIHIGGIPAGLDIHHKCMTRACVNPMHLEPLSRRDNLLKSTNVIVKQVRQTHCLNGHPLTLGNLDKHQWEHFGKRACKICKAAREMCRHRTRKAKQQELV